MLGAGSKRSKRWDLSREHERLLYSKCVYLSKFISVFGTMNNEQSTANHAIAERFPAWVAFTFFSTLSVGAAASQLASDHTPLILVVVIISFIFAVATSLLYLVAPQHLASSTCEIVAVRGTMSKIFEMKDCESYIDFTFSFRFRLVVKATVLLPFWAIGLSMLPAPEHGLIVDACAATVHQVTHYLLCWAAFANLICIAGLLALDVACPPILAKQDLRLTCRKAHHCFRYMCWIGLMLISFILFSTLVQLCRNSNTQPPQDGSCTNATAAQAGMFAGSFFLSSSMIFCVLNEETMPGHFEFKYTMLAMMLMCTFPAVIMILFEDSPTGTIPFCFRYYSAWLCMILATVCFAETLGYIIVKQRELEDHRLPLRVNVGTNPPTTALPSRQASSDLPSDSSISTEE